MKKTNQLTNRSQELNRKNYHSPTRFPKKQFQLIYREKQHLPSSEAFQSIIFMKSKKCSNKGHHKVKKEPTQDIKKVFNKIQKSLKQEHSNPKHNNYHSSGGVLKNKINCDNYAKKSDSYKNKSSIKYHKAGIADNQNAKKYKAMASPVRETKQKVSEQPTATTHFSRTLQQTIRKEVKSKGKRSKKQTQNSFHNVCDNQQPEEYLFLQNNFVEINPKQASTLDEKFTLRRQEEQQISCSKSSFQQKKEQIEDKTLKDEGIEASSRQIVSRGQSPANSYSLDKNCTGNNLNIIQQYFTNKVEIIQRWWRKITAKHKKGQKQLNTIMKNCQIDPIQKVDFIEPDSSKSFIFQSVQPQNQETGLREEEVMNNSPIKLIDQFESNNEEENQGAQIITMRENAARKQMNTNLQLLEKLYIEQKISSSIYLQRKDMISLKFQEELRQIEDLRMVLRNNISKTVELQNNVKQSIKLLQKDNIQINNQILDTIFGHQSQNQHQKGRLLEIPMIPNELIPQRQKSTGCHFHSQDTVRASLYKKDQFQEEQYKQDFQEQGDTQQETNINEFFNQNQASEASMTNNFKELLDEFKAREDVKMQIDKRAAIQMGVMTEEILPQIRDQIVKIDTSLSSIHRFILALFKYYIFYYKFDFLRLINMPFGYNIDQRIKALQGYSGPPAPQEDEDGVIYGLEDVIPQSIFEEFYEKVYDISSQQQQHFSSAKKANFEFQKIHNKAIFDSFNEAMNIFRPYFMINGPPFPWTNSEKALTFYFIAEENIQQVFEKTQFKVLKWASALCGIIVDKYSNYQVQLTENQTPESIIQKYQNSSHQLVNQTRQDRLAKNQKVQVDQNNLEWNIFQQQKTINLIQSAELVFTSLIQQIEQQLYTIAKCGRNQTERIGDQEEGAYLEGMSQESSLSEFQLC